MALTALSPLDERYTTQVQALAPYFSEWALIRYRVQVEIAWLVLLSERPECPEVRLMSAAEQQLLQDWVTTFDVQQAQRVKALEATIQHDVKAVEYYLKERLQGTSLADLGEWVHFCFSYTLTPQNIDRAFNMLHHLRYTGEIIDRALSDEEA